MNEPKDYEYLLLCDGSTISEENYPELVAVLGGTQLPNLIDRFLQGSATAGTYKEAGLPDVSGQITGVGGGHSIIPTGSGAFSTAGKVESQKFEIRTDINSGGYTTVTLKASKSNSIYGNSNTVQPPAYTAKIYICFAG